MALLLTTTTELVNFSGSLSGRVTPFPGRVESQNLDPRATLLRGSTSDPERAAISLTSCLADLGSCTNCQQGGLLQLGSRWYLWPAARPVAARLECRRPFGFLNEAVRTHNPIAS